MALRHNGDVPSVSPHQLKRYPDAAEKIIVFDKYQDVSAKDQVPIDYELSITGPLPKRDAIMKSKNNKRRLASELSTFTVGDMMTTESRDATGASLVCIIDIYINRNGFFHFDCRHGWSGTVTYNKLF